MDHKEISPEGRMQLLISYENYLEGFLKLENKEQAEIHAKKEFNDFELNIIKEEQKKLGKNTERINIVLPNVKRPISNFAIEIGNFFEKKTILFYRPSSKEVIRLDNLFPEGSDLGRIEVFQRVKSSEFVTFVEKFVDIGKNSKDEDSRHEIFLKNSMRTDLANNVLESQQFKEKLPMIDKIFNVQYPIIKDGSLKLLKKGYDEEFQSWVSLKSPEMDENLSVDEAKKNIEGMLNEFCFKNSNQDKVNAIVGILTPFCRMLYSRIVSRTPIFFYKANRERSGKDYLAGITGIIYEGVAIEETPFSDGKNTNEEEIRKKISSIFLKGKNRMHSSNNKGYISSSILEMLATSEVWSDRLLGGNSIVEFPNIIEISMSANTGVTYTPDLAKRCIFINLFLDIEDPNKRKFDKPDLHKWVKENRGLILSSLFALIRNWVEKGMPSGSVEFSSFPEWSRVVGGIMEYAGYTSPCIDNDELSIIGGDTETKDMKKLFELSHEKWKDQWITKQQIMNEIETSDSDFCELFSWFEWYNEGGSGRKKFGILIKKFIGREFSGIKLFEMEADRSSRSKYMFTKRKNVLEATSSNVEVEDQQLILSEI